MTRAYIHFPYLTGFDNSMGVFVRQLARAFSEDGFEVIICSIAGVSTEFSQIVIPKCARTSVGRIDSIALQLRMLFSVLNSSEFIIINVSQEFIYPWFLRRTMNIIHDTIQIHYPRSRMISFLNKRWWRLARKAKINIAVSRSTQLELRKLDIKSSVIYNCFDKVAVSEEFSNSASGKCFDAIWCGNALKHKNFALFLELCRLHSHRKFCAILPRSDLNGLKESGIPQNVSLHTSLNDDEYKCMIRCSKMLISTSLMEGYGRPPMDALLLGVPVLVSDIPVFRELYSEWATLHELTASSLNAAFVRLLDKVVGGITNVPPVDQLQLFHGQPESFARIARQSFQLRCLHGSNT